MTAATAPRPLSVAPARSTAGQARSSGSYGAVERILATGSLALLVVADVVVLPWTPGGVPVRGFVAVGLLIIGAFVYPVESSLAIRSKLSLLFLAAALALEGLFVSLVDHNQFSDIVQNIVQVFVQAGVTLIVASILAQIAGARLCVLVIVGVVAASAFVAVLQMLGVHPAWALRLALGPLAHQEFAVEAIDKRPTGLAFSPIQLATHLCLAFAVYTAFRYRQRQLTVGNVTADPAVLIALGALLVASIATGTRAPILGGLAFLALYVLMRRSSWLLVVLLIGGALLAIAWPLVFSIIQGNAPRVVQVDDNSAQARWVFAYYGIRLFLANPLGYGFGFDPSKMWVGYWADLYMMQAAKGAQIHPLHNYLLSMINIYGVGILLVVPFAVNLLRRARGSLLYFVPYMIQILFHNSGPLYDDNVIWIIIAVLAATGTALHNPEASKARPIISKYRSVDGFGSWSSMNVPGGPLAPVSRFRRRIQ